MLGDIVQMLVDLGLSEAEAKRAADAAWAEIQEMRAGDPAWVDTEAAVESGEADYPDGPPNPSHR